MLATLLIWLYTFFLCYVYGFLFLKLLRTEGDFPAAPLVVVTGLVVLTTLASFFSLFFQTGLLLNLLLLAGAVGAVLTRSIPLPRRRPMSLVSLIVLFLALLLVLETATHRPLNPDTNIYHAQAIHWIENFPAVPGLGNLHGRLAYNSSWFISNALFSLTFLGLGSFHLTAGVLFLSILIYFWGGLSEMFRGEYTPAALLKVLFIPLMFSLLGAEISSPGTDLPASLLLWLMAVLWAEEQGPFHAVLIVILAVFVVTVKLSAAPALLLALFVLGGQLLRREKRSLVSAAVCGALALFPFLTRNVILSGYLLYPFPSVDIFSFDWKVPLERVVSERMSILAWGRFPRLDATRVLAMPFGEWFPKWLAEQTLSRKVILWATLFSPLAVLPGLRLVRRFWLGWLVFYAGALFWLFSAPDFRFGYGFLIGTIAMALAPWFASVLKRSTFPATRISAVISLLIAGYLALVFATSFEARTFASRLLLPAGYDHVATQSCDLANGKVFCAKAYDACSYDAFPCIPSPRPKVELRDPVTLGDGFRTLP
jgi:hypothetical protein